jgi:hypothetical protein
MGTDATGIIEVSDAPGTSPDRGRRTSPFPWARVLFDRDYVLFDLLAGGRSCDPDDAVVPLAEDMVAGVSACFRVADLELVHDAYRFKQGVESRDLRAIIAAMQALNDGDEERTKLFVSFC